MSKKNTPSIDPANDGDFLGTMRHILGKELQNINGMLPAKVISFNRAKNRATVQPLVMLLTTSNTTVPRASIASVPVYQIGGGGFMLNFNLKAGDLGWIKACDRDISLFLQSYNISAPNTLRKFNFSDAVFFPDVMRGYTINEEDAENAVLQNLDGSVRISLWQNKVKITSPFVEIDAPNVTMSGKLDVTGDITSLSKVTAPLLVGINDVTFNGISGTSHVHSGVQSGASNTGVPQ